MSKKSKIFGKYTCLECGHKWKEKLQGPNTTCPKKCKDFKIKWLNFEKLVNDKKIDN